MRGRKKNQGLRLRLPTLGVATALVWAIPAGVQAQTPGTGLGLPTGLGTPPAVDAHWNEGRIKLDLAVSDEAGRPVAGLDVRQITLLDEGQPTKVATFQGFDGRETFPVDDTQVIVVIDALNLESLQVDAGKRALRETMQANSNDLHHLTSIYQLDADGIKLLAPPSVSGPDLAKALDNGKTAKALRETGCRSESARNEISLKAFGRFVLEQRRLEGRKIVIWIGPGWPVATSCTESHGGFQNSFGWVTEFSTRMREARIELNSVSVWAATAWSGDPGDTPEGWRKDGAAAPDDLSLSRLAHQSGGRILQSSNNLGEMLRRCMADADALYLVTFDPPQALKADEYHRLSVKLARPGLTARTYTGYFDEPVLYDRPAKLERVTAVQLETMVGTARESGDGRFAEQLAHSVSTERLSHTTVVDWQSRLPGKKSREALELLSSEASFEDPPPSRVPARDAPSVTEQRVILGKMLGYLKDQLPTLPDFFATRLVTTYAEPPPIPQGSEPLSLSLDQLMELRQNGVLRIEAPEDKKGLWKTQTGDGILRQNRTEKETIHYTNGKEEVDESTRKSRENRSFAETLGTVGTFGPILRVVLVDAAPTLRWSRWEQGARGLRAVFRFDVAKEKSHYSNSFCCMTDMDGSRPAKWNTAYHGEVAIDAETGQILRIAVQAELDPRSPVNRADIMVTYGPVQIGRQTYICPVRSVAISRKRTVNELHEWGDSLRVFGPYITIMNDVSFTGYRKFGSEMRMLPGVTETEK